MRPRGINSPQISPNGSTTRESLFETRYLALDRVTLRHPYRLARISRRPAAENFAELQAASTILSTSGEERLHLQNKMNAIVIFCLTLVGCSVAFPARPSNDLGLLVGVPVLIDDPTVSQAKQEDGSASMVYGLLLSKLVETEDNVDGGPIEKRSVDENAAADDLETAAGTYALRPLFVYRQQLAYRERVREAIRRGNRF